MFSLFGKHKALCLFGHNVIDFKIPLVEAGPFVIRREVPGNWASINFFFEKVQYGNWLLKY